MSAFLSSPADSNWLNKPLTLRWSAFSSSTGFVVVCIAILGPFRSSVIGQQIWPWFLEPFSGGQRCERAKNGEVGLRRNRTDCGPSRLRRRDADAASCYAEGRFVAAQSIWVSVRRNRHDRSALTRTTAG